MRRRIANLPMTRKFVVLCTLLAIGVILLAVAAARLQYLDLVDARKQTVKTQVDMGMSVLQHYADQAKRGEITEAQAKQAAKAALADMKTNGGVDYFFIVDPQMRILMHPKRKVGTDMTDYKSDAGEYVYRDIRTAVTSGDGFSYYTSPKPGKKEQLPKISYAKLYPQWNWVLVMGVYAEDIQVEALGFTKILTIIGAALVGMVVGLCWLIASAIVTPLRAATRTAEAIASGRFDNTIKVESRDETGQLMTSMQQMQTQLQRFNGEMQTLVQLQQGDDISHRMPEDFPGDYGTLARGMNTALFEHLDAIIEAMAIMGEYGRGDLRRDMRRLPGQRAALHEALDAVKRNLSAINGDIARLADAAARGDFSARGDEARYQFAFKEMVEALNRLMRQAESGLADVGRIMGAIADGDLSQRVEVRYEGAFGQLADAANRTAEQLTTIVQGIQRSVESINTAAGEIASGNSDLSVRTEQQAASLEETAASMEELTSTVKQNADSARQANQLVLGAGEVAESGGRVVEDVVTTMASISAASTRIADIIGVIDGIAFQTNILALNAAVEAARAGEQGRGFAVVASEVRSLAQRSAAAAKEIKTLISDSVQEVQQGSTLVARAGTTMAEVVTSVKRVTDIMAEISAASAEQSSGIEQVSKTVMQLDEATQQNAALVEEATAAAKSMEDQASDLTRAVAVFRLAGAAQPLAAAVSTPRVAPPPVRPALAARAPIKQASAPAPRPLARSKPRGALVESPEWEEF
ncbi:methyl-accepting chemotaxis protein [Xanthomonas translucens]|uniref:methyl-accepting chemotaxis protein n=7 Tax=Xanthomonas campestris pv. translucens TaxID=343 RepID=UPI0016546544|nr:methyl-accepting chemotaxis protein [Xanthomonas translucens]MBC3972472.1 cache domain-containing protein [Xanthomonas translucens pv. undulosa]MCT8283685.1 methyl-accepting chemotaxis protein [Xanthomonas translucens pv. undulosa]MCT8318455.1 methyl-accepting chemotaxis protein [Xanthomonas translucens pv. undulosa]QSQ58215.1 cache domain-containing protein [Xanthomonas translucens pv. undulosa]UKE41511.1 cache domain-containing protein [Xanthomonas translucens pv. undulosa]